MSSTFTRATHWAVALILMASAHAFAADGVIKSASGDIFVNGAAASQGDEVSSGDTLKTAFGAWMVVEMDDQSVLDVRSDTEVELTDYVYNPAAPENNNQDVNVVDGTLRYASGLIGKNDYDDVAVRAGDYTVGIRGTQFEIVYNRTSGTVSLRVTSGTVGISFSATRFSQQLMDKDGKPIELEAGSDPVALAPNADGTFTLKRGGEVIVFKVEGGNLQVESASSAMSREYRGLGESEATELADSFDAALAQGFNQAISNTDE